MIAPRASIVVILSSIVVASAAAPAGAVEGRLDKRFSGDGRATTFSAGAAAYGVAIDGDGTIVLAGSTAGDGDTDVAVARFRPGGDLEPTFGGTGRVAIDLGGFEYGFDLAIQDDGKIVVAGERVRARSDVMLLVRLEPDGDLDATFSGDGRLQIDFGRPFQAATSVAIDGQDRIVVGGYAAGGTTSRWALARVLSDGTLDASFGGDGLVATNVSDGAEQIHDVATDPSDRVIAVGEAEVRGAARFGIARYAEDGTPDTSFSGNGRELTDVATGGDVAYGVAPVPDGGYVAAGLARDGGRGSWGLVRYRQHGGLVNRFGRNGVRVIDLEPALEFASAVVVRPNGKILAAGRGRRTETGDDMLVIRLLDDGSFDRSFANDGRSYVDFAAEDDTARSIAIDSFGRVVVAGEARRSGASRFGVARLRS